MTTLKISGMTCGHCVMHAKKALGAVPGVTSAEVDLASGLAQVQGEAPLEDLVAAIEGEGYSAVQA